MGIPAKNGLHIFGARPLEIKAKVFVPAK